MQTNLRKAPSFQNTFNLLVKLKMFWKLGASKPFLTLAGDSPQSQSRLEGQIQDVLETERI